MESRRGSPAARHRFAVSLAGAVIALIAAGALVTSKQAGLAVPDWPLSYGSLNPPRWWEIENVRAEHGHRLIAGTVALLTVALAVWTGRREERGWVRRLAWLAVAAVLAQALLGGVTVLLFLPTAVSVSHAALAQLFLCLVTSLAVVTSRSWRHPVTAPPPGAGRIAPLAAATTGLVYVQILLGAVMRHSGAGLAIPDFPLAFGRIVPPVLSFPVAIHYAHRVGALVVVLAVAWTLGRAVRCCSGQRRILGPAVAMAVLVAAQVTLGATVVLSGKAVLPNTVHVATGAALLATSLMVTLEAWRLRRGRAAAPAPSAVPAVAGAPTAAAEPAS